MAEKGFEFLGGALCLDFHNTASWDPDDPAASERLHAYDDLLHWARDAGVVSPVEGDRLEDLAAADAAGAARAFADAMALRRTLHDVFHPPVAGGGRDPGALRALNGYLARLPLGLRPTSGGGPYVWDWSRDPADPAWILWPVVWSAASLLMSRETISVKSCASAHCGWLFVDRSRRRNRKWCDMGDCGNREKARRYYRRHRRPKGEAGGARESDEPTRDAGPG